MTTRGIVKAEEEAGTATEEALRETLREALIEAVEKKGRCRPRPRGPGHLTTPRGRDLGTRGGR